VLTGIHLTSYGRDLGGLTLLDAVRAAAVDGLNRLRLGSLEPVIASAAFVESLAHIPVVCPQFHLSLQSGSDSMLRRMRRRYTAEEYLAAARRLQDAFPGCALTTDVLVGFPGETQEEFEQTLAFCEQVGFAKMHIFPFSRRAGTAADRMPGQLSRALKTERARQMAALEARMSKGFMASFLGSSQDVLFETLTKDGLALGHTPNAINVYCPGGSPGKIQKVRLLAPLDDGLRATLLSSS
jgi:threonylcarbamoyladenosine tRNA methylthiotransferase MtaB